MLAMGVKPGMQSTSGETVVWNPTSTTGQLQGTGKASSPLKKHIYSYNDIFLILNHMLCHQHFFSQFSLINYKTFNVVFFSLSPFNTLQNYWIYGPTTKKKNYLRTKMQQFLLTAQDSEAWMSLNLVKYVLWKPILWKPIGTLIVFVTGGVIIKLATWYLLKI